MSRRKVEERIGIMQLKNIKEFTKEWKAAMKAEVAQMTEVPKLLIIQVGDIEASNRYVRNKIKDCEEVGMMCDLLKFDEHITSEKLQDTIYEVQPEYDGVMVQLPLPKHINLDILNSIKGAKDVDGLTKNTKFNPCTPFGIMKYLEACEFDFTGKHAVVIGRSEIVGKPMARLLLEKNATVTTCHSKTKNLYHHLTQADLIVSAVGSPGIVNATVISPDVPIIDVGINFVEGKLIGDVWNPSERENITPVPGGVGLLTRCALLQNTLDAAKYYR